MIKDATRDYATNAFILYSALGCPTRDEYEAQIRREVYRKLATIPPDRLLAIADSEVMKKKSKLEDVAAVNKMFDMLSLETAKDGDMIIRAVRYVYFGYTSPNPPVKGITLKVRTFSQKNYVSERLVFDWLKQARHLFASLRGLTIDFRENVQ